MRGFKYLPRSVLVSVRFLLSIMFLWILAGCMNSLFYFPNQKDYESGPKQHSQVYSDHYWQTADGITLHGWLIPAQSEGTLIEAPIGTVLFAHGNAANITTHYWLLSWMPKVGINVFIFDYRGFGQSKGRSTFKGTELDTISALHYLKNLASIDSEKIIGLGQSLGGNSMIVMLGKNQDSAVKGLIVDGAFYNHQSIANYYLPGAGFFVSKGYGASDYIESVTVPILFIHGLEDRIVPYRHSEMLYQKANTPKELYLVEGAAHILTLEEIAVQQKILQFITQTLDQSAMDLDEGLKMKEYLSNESMADGMEKGTPNGTKD